MSQQKGLLTEDEIHEYLNQAFGLKIDRELLLKPTKEFAVDIYARFLDTTGHKWRNPTIDPSFHRPIIVNRIRRILSHYNINITFGEMDLIMPNRKRTTTFLNVLIYVHAQLEQVYSPWQLAKEDWAARQDQLGALKKQISDMKLEIEKIAIENAKIGEVNRMKPLIVEKRSEFDAKQQVIKRLENEKDKVKTRYKSQLAFIEKLQAEKKLQEDRLVELRNTKQILDDGLKMERRIVELVREIERLKISKDKRDQAEKKALKLEAERGRQHSDYDALMRELELTRKMFAKFIETRDALYSKRVNSEDKFLKLRTGVDNVSRRIELKEKEKIKQISQSRIDEQRLRLELAELRSKLTDLETDKRIKIQELDEQISNAQKEINTIMSNQAAKSTALDERLERSARTLEERAQMLAEKQELYQRLLNDIKYVCPFINYIKREQSANRTYIKN